MCKKVTINGVHMSISNADTGTLPLASKGKNSLSPTRSFYVSMLLPGERNSLFRPHAGRRFDHQPESHECGIVISSNSVSRKHARIAMKGGDVLLEDLGSRNGTWKNGKRVMVPTLLKPGDEAGVGTAILAVHEVLPWSTRHEGLLDHESFIERLHQKFDRNRLCKRTFSVAALVFPPNTSPPKPIWRPFTTVCGRCSVRWWWWSHYAPPLWSTRNRTKRKREFSQVHPHNVLNTNYTLQTKVLSFPEDAQRA